jgi:mono/diheme cytochrome c family protein
MFDGLYQFIYNNFGYAHPLHPTQVNMPIGLTVGAFVFILVVVVFGKKELMSTARATLLLALLFILPTVAAGFMDWQHFFGGVWFFPIEITMILAGVLFVLLLLATLLAGKPERKGIVLLLTFTAFCTAVTLGFLGAQIVFRADAPISKQHPQGQAIYLGNCSGCHPRGSNILKPNMPIIKSDKLDNFMDFVGWIRKPKKPMPEFSPKKISNEQAQQLYDYLSSLWGPMAEKKEKEEKGKGESAQGDME